jgi:hypothetical protein
MERAIKMPQLINLSRKGLDFFKDAPDFLFIYSTRQFIPRFVILSERSESKEPLRIQADPSAALGMTIEDHSG